VVLKRATLALPRRRWRGCACCLSLSFKDASMPSIKSAVNTLSAKVNQIARQSGDPKTLATQEVKQAFDKGLITKPQRDILARAISDSGNDPKEIKKTLAKYIQAFERADTNKNGRSDKAERVKAQANLDKWMWTAASTQVPQAEKDRLKKPVIKVDTVGQSGKIFQQPVFGVETLLTKLDKLQGPQTPAEKYAGFANETIKAAVGDGKISKADAKKIINSYHWTQHAEFTTLMADKAIKFDAGAKGIIKDFLNGPLPE
jgi:hypothetical protein